MELLLEAYLSVDLSRTELRCSRGGGEEIGGRRCWGMDARQTWKSDRPRSFRFSSPVGSCSNLITKFCNTAQVWMWQALFHVCSSARFNIFLLEHSALEVRRIFPAVWNMNEANFENSPHELLSSISEYSDYHIAIRAYVAADLPPELSALKRSLRGWSSYDVHLSLRLTHSFTDWQCDDRADGLYIVVLSDATSEAPVQLHDSGGKPAEEENWPKPTCSAIKSEGNAQQATHPPDNTSKLTANGCLLLVL